MRTKVGSKLLEIREDRKMSQEEFAEFLGFSSSAYGRLERNETSIEIDQMLGIAQKLDVPIQEFLPETITINNKDNRNQAAGIVFYGNQTIHNYYCSESDAIKQKDEELIRLRKEVAALEKKLEGKD